MFNERIDIVEQGQQLRVLGRRERHSRTAEPCACAGAGQRVRLQLLLLIPRSEHDKHIYTIELH